MKGGDVQGIEGKSTYNNETMEWDVQRTMKSGGGPPDAKDMKGKSKGMAHASIPPWDAKKRKRYGFSHRLTECLKGKTNETRDDGGL